MLFPTLLLATRLIFDIGNSDIMGVQYEEGEKIAELRFSHSQPWQGKLAESLEQLNPNEIFIGSVNHTIDQELQNLIAQSGREAHMMNKRALNLKIDPDTVEKVGADLLANAYGALANRQRDF